MVTKILVLRSPTLFLLSSILLSLLLSCGSQPKITISPDAILSAHIIKNLDGEKVNIEDHLGKPLLIAYWATWCKYCKKDKAALDEFRRKRGRSNNIILLSDEKATILTDYKEKTDYNSFTYLQSDKNLKSYGITQRPSYAYFSAEGHHLETINGSVDFKMLVGMEEYHKLKRK